MSFIKHVNLINKCYNKINVSEGIGVNKTSKSYMIICSYYYFLKVKIRSQARVCDSFRNVIQNVESLKDVAIVPVIRNHYRIHYWYMSKGVVINGTNGADLKETDACNIKKLLSFLIIESE